MLRLLTVPLTFPEGERVHPSMGSIFHGAMLQKLPPEARETLHEGARPFSLAVFFDGGKERAVLRLSFLNDAIYETMAPHLAPGEEFLLTQKSELTSGDARAFKRPAANYIVTLGAGELRQTSFTALADEIFLSAPPIGAKFCFLTTTSFKRAGKYVIWPESFLLWQSLLAKWNNHSEALKIEGTDLAEKFAEFTRTCRYRLRSAPFSLEGLTIYGFLGEEVLKFAGTGEVNRLLALLAAYAPFAGVGIKTALGMGAVETNLIRRNP